MDDRNEKTNSKKRARRLLASRTPLLDALPLKALLEVVPHTDVISTIQMTQVSGFNVIPTK
jgi:hypothetical protein